MLEDFGDGCGNTLAVIETARDNGSWTAGGWPTARGLDPVGGPCLGQNGQFGGGHRGTNALFADGSVRCLTDAVAPEVFEALATLAGGEEVGRAGDE